MTTVEVINDSGNDSNIPLTLTGNFFVNNGLAVIAALAGCRRIEDLTLDKAKQVHEDGTKLARGNMRLKSNTMIFTTNCMTARPGWSKEEKINEYRKMTTRLVNAIGHEDKNEFCDFCDCAKSISFIQVGREWFPLAGSLGSDAQALPGASRSYNSCAKCLFAVQYLPLVSILVNGQLALFQATSIKLWYSWVK